MSIKSTGVSGSRRPVRKVGLRAVAAAALGLAMTSGPAAAEWSLQDGSTLFPGVPAATGPTADGAAGLTVTCLSGETPLLVFEARAVEGPPAGQLTLAVDGQPYRVEAQREDRMWIATATPSLVSALARGARLAAAVPGAKEEIISLRGSARTLGEALSTCG